MARLLFMEAFIPGNAIGCNGAIGPIRVVSAAVDALRGCAFFGFNRIDADSLFTSAPSCIHIRWSN